MLSLALVSLVMSSAQADSRQQLTTRPTSSDIRPPLEATNVAGVQSSRLDDITVIKYATSFRVPIASDANGFLFLLGADYAFEDAIFDTRLGSLDRLRAHRLALAGRGNVRFGERWGLAFELKGIYASDLSAEVVASIQPFARASLGYSYSRELSLQAGLVWTRSRLGLVPFVGAGAVYRPSGSRWRFNLVIPNPNVSYALNDTARVFVQVGLNTSTNAVKLDSGDDAFIHRLQIISAIGIRWRIFGAFALSAEAGAVALQNYQLRNLETDETFGRTSGLGSYASVGLVRLLD